MTPSALLEYSHAIAARHAETMALVDQIEPTAADAESSDHQADAYAEGLFFRVFTSYENDIEKLFLHYVMGGASLSGATARSYLNVETEELAQKLIRAGWRFLSWGKPERIRETAQNYIQDGWPICLSMNAKSQELSDCDRIRNRIAHMSTESLTQFNVVQRNLLKTERLFPITPGQLLRIRSTRFKKLHIGHYCDVMTETIGAIVDPPP